MTHLVYDLYLSKETVVMINTTDDYQCGDSHWLLVKWSTWGKGQRVWLLTIKHRNSKVKVSY